jgi:hypothetical protein
LVLIWNIAEERARLAYFEKQAQQSENNEVVQRLLEDLIRATKRKILALEQLEALDTIKTKDFGATESS